MQEVEEKIKKTKRERRIFNPFPGLRPFSPDESHLFFGREKQAVEILDMLKENQFVAVLGASGSGKSSLVYSGVIPMLHGGFLDDGMTRWKTVKIRPGNQPLHNLAEFLFHDKPADDDINKEQKSIIINEAILSTGTRGFIDMIQQKMRPGDNLLFLVDQFEELFRYRGSSQNGSSLNETEAFIKLLTGIVHHPGISAHVILTARSDYLGECSAFPELASLINKSSYLIPSMTREDFKAAIIGPVAVGGGEIDTVLVQSLLNEIEGNPDQLPIMQHALMRTWDFWQNHGFTHRPIDFSDYQSIGKLEKALSDHANEAYEELDDQGKFVCEKIFKSLTEKGNDGRGIRRPTAVGDLASIAGATVDEVKEVVKKFREPERAFLNPPEPLLIEDNTVIDITHESLMRVWDKLKNWVAEEHESALMYTRLSESSLQYQMGKTGLWRQPDLQLALNWREKEKPTLAWAQRLNPAFERTVVYLKTSEQEYIQEEQNKERLQKKALRRTKMFAIVLGSAAVVSLFFMLFANIQRIEVEKQRKIAEQQRELAEEQRVIAEQKTEEAEEQRDIARQALIEAELQKIVADKQTTISQEQRQLAEQKATEAIQLQEVARDNLKQAEEQRKLALQNATEAEKQSKLADEKSREALKRRMVSIAQSMAVKSLQINDDALKGLVAYQAYRFNKEYDGPERQPDIYTALYKAEKNLRSPSHNVLKGHVGAVNSMVFNNSGNVLYSTGGDGKIIRYDLNNRSNSGTVLARNDFINRSLDISNNGRWLACGTARSIIQLYNTSDFSRPAAILEGHRGIVGDVAFTPDNRYLISACTDDRTIRIWNLNNFESTILASTDARVRSIDISPDGRYIVGSTNDGKLILWDRNAGNSSSVLANEPNNAFYVVSFSNSGNYIAAGDKKGNLKLWNANTSRLVKILRSHSARIVDVKFSPGDKLIATSSYDGTISLWEFSQLDQNPVVLQEHDSWVLSIAFSPDGKYVVSSSDEGNLMIVWPTGSNIMAQSFCNLLPRDMTREEWEIYVAPDIDYEKTCK